MLLERAPAKSRRLADLFELPTGEQLGITAAELRPAAILATKKRGITRYAITETIYRHPAPAGPLPAGLFWISATELDTITLSGPHRRWVTELLAATSK